MKKAAGASLDVPATLSMVSGLERLSQARETMTAFNPSGYSGDMLPNEILRATS
jgi:hypothetical protein